MLRRLLDGDRYRYGLAIFIRDIRGGGIARNQREPQRGPQFSRDQETR
jgi:hypothetical protein